MSDLVWRNVNDELPNKTCWCLVFAPKYLGGSSGGKEYVRGILFSKYNVAKNGNKSWSVESQYRNRNCVKFWMPLPEKPVFDEPEETTSKYKQLEFPFEG